MRRTAIMALEKNSIIQLYLTDRPGDGRQSSRREATLPAERSQWLARMSRRDERF